MTGGRNDTREVKATIGKNLQKAREGKKLSRKKFAEQLNEYVNRPIINGMQEEMTEDRLKTWEYGTNAINIEWIPLLCKALDCDVGYLFGEYDEKTRELSDTCAVTGLSEKSVKNLLYLKGISQIGNFFFVEDVICKAFSEEETPAWVINYFMEDEKILHLLYLFFVIEDMDKGNVVEHTRSNAILIELIGILTNRRNILGKTIGSKREVTNNGKYPRAPGQIR